MDTIWLVAIAIAVLLAIAAVALLLYRRGPRSERKLRRRFGPEYDRTQHRIGDEEVARQDLAHRLERRQRFDIRDLDEDEQRRFADAWRDVQHRFVDDPSGSVHEADLLIQRVMSTRGYPVETFDQRARDLSVDHPEVVQHYRAGRRLLGRGERVPTEHHREAMLHYRALYERLVDGAVAPVGTAHREDARKEPA